MYSNIAVKFFPTEEEAVQYVLEREFPTMLLYSEEDYLRGVRRCTWSAPAEGAPRQGVEWSMREGQTVPLRPQYTVVHTVAEVLEWFEQRSGASVFTCHNSLGLEFGWVSHARSLEGVSEVVQISLLDARTSNTPEQKEVFLTHMRRGWADQHRSLPEALEHLLSEDDFDFIGGP